MKLKTSSSAQILSKRLKKLQRHLSADGRDLCLIDHPLDLFYYTGISFSAGYLLVSPRAALLVVDGRYIQMAKESSPIPVSLDGPEVFEGFLKQQRVKAAVFDGSRVPYDQYLRLKKKASFAGAKFASDASFFQTFRAVKDKREIEIMRQSAQLAYEGFLYIRGILKVGITEKEVARRFEIFCLERGAEGLSFEPIIAFGANTAMPHYRPQEVKLRSGDLVLIDIGVVVDHYHSDMTRVLFFQKQPAFFREIYEIVVKAQKAALAKCRAGASVAELDIAAREVMRAADKEKYFLHSLGHGIGLQTHEYPRLKSQGKDTRDLLEAGMVITVEPGLYFEGRGGIRYEDTVLVTETGYENFYPEYEESVICNFLHSKGSR